jgi:hypothetical protein
MIRKTALAVVWSIACAATLGAGTPRPASEGPAPTMALVKLAGDDTVSIKATVVAYFQELRTKTIDIDGKAQTVTYPVTVSRAREVQLSSPAHGLRGYAVGGKPLDGKALRERLKDWTPVALSADGRPLDPRFQGLLRDGTVVLLLPPSQAPNAVPQPAPPKAP